MTAAVTRQTAVIQAEHVLRALQNATERIGRSLTVHAGLPSAAPGLARAIAAAQDAHPELLAEILGRSPEEPFREVEAERLRLPEQVL